MLTFKEVRDRGLLLYEFIRGSVCHGINTPTSDVDLGGIYMCPPEQLLGLGYDYQEQISDERNDVVWLELNKFMRLLLSSNPTVLEALFVDDEHVIYEHPLITELKKHRDLFITKACFDPLFGYAKSQISKARGLNKKITNPMPERKSILDFCTVPVDQGTKKVQDWLEDLGLKQKYCGLVKLPNSEEGYGLYYDFGTHICCEYGANLTNKASLDEVWDNIFKEKINFKYVGNKQSFYDSLTDYLASWGFNLPFRILLNQVTPLGFKGIINENVDSNDVRVSEVPKNMKPLTILFYNQRGYESHCRQYKEYKEWEAKRNPVRYESNLDKNYDSKNMSECFRMVNMAMEIARGEGVHVNRRGIDADFLLDIRAHKYEYDELIKMIEEKTEEMKVLAEKSTIPESIDRESINQLLLLMRNTQLKNYVS